MNRKLYRIFVMCLIIQIVLSTFAPTIVYANDAVMLEALIEPQTKTYKVDVIEDKPVWFADHYEQKYINFDSYYTSICSDARDGDKIKLDAFISNPTHCSSLDSQIDLTYGPSPDVQSTVTDAYDAYMILEGFRDSNGLIVDDSKKSTALGNGAAKTSSFASNTPKNGIKVLTFPSSHSDGDDVTEAETEYAIHIGNTLSSNLNSMLAFINNGRRFQSVTELVNKSILIRPTSHNYTIVRGLDNNKNFIIIYGTLDVYGNGNEAKSAVQGDFSRLSSFSADAFWKTGNFPNTDSDGNLLAYVIPTSQTNVSYGSVDVSKINPSEIASFVWAMPKGYTKIDALPTPIRFTNDSHEQYKFVEEGNDVPWITIHQLTMYANNAYKNFNMSMSSKLTGEGNGNVIMEILVGIIKMLINGLRSILGLNDTYSLVFNKGARGSSSYNYGVMPDSWWTVVLRYHIIFQSLAWFLIITGLIKTLIDLNLSTINPGKRMHVYKTIERFIVVGFGLVLVIPITQFLLNMNDSIVKIFASQADPNASSPPVIGTLAGLVLQVAYFGIVVYINFTYIMRSIIIGILVVTAPFFISSMAFSDNNRQLFSSWARELLANIFMQSIHAFSLAFLTNLISTGGGLESLVVSYSIIPITELVRTLVFQGAGSHASQLGKAAGAKYMNGVQGVTQTSGSLVAGGIAKGLDKGSEAGDTSLLESTGGKGGRGAKGGETAMQGLQNAVDSRMSGIKEGAKAKMQDKDASATTRFKANAARMGASALQAGMAGASAMSHVGGAAWDMAMGEMTNDVSSYKSAGSNLANATAKGGESVVRGAQAGISGVATASSGIDSYKENAQTRQGGGDPKAPTTHDSNIALRPSQILKDDRTGLTMSKFTNSARGGANYTNQGRSLVETISNDGINQMASGNSNLSAFYRDVQKINSGNEILRNNYAKKGIMIQSDDNNNANIVYTEKYLQDNNMVSATALKDGKGFLVRGRAGVDSFGVTSGTSEQNPSMLLDETKQPNSGIIVGQDNRPLTRG